MVFDKNEVAIIVLKLYLWRSLKTASSARIIPLVGSAKWAAERILAQPDDSEFAFPNYNDGVCTNANSASAALNKWLHQYVPEGCTMHSFRHSMRDRLRAAECPSDIIDQIGGWATNGIGESYGKGYELNILYKYIKML